MEQIILAWFYGFFACIGILLIYFAFDFLGGLPEAIAESVTERHTEYEASLIVLAHWFMGGCIAIMMSAFGLMFIMMGRCQWLSTVAFTALAGCGFFFALFAMLETMREGNFFAGVILFFVLTGAGFAVGGFVMFASDLISDAFGGSRRW